MFLYISSLNLYFFILYSFIFSGTAGKPREKGSKPRFYSDT